MKQSVFKTCVRDVNFRAPNFSSGTPNFSSGIYLVLSMEVTILALIQSFQEANFALYCDALSELIPFFFANNNINYA